MIFPQINETVLKLHLFVIRCAEFFQFKAFPLTQIGNEYMKTSFSLFACLTA